MCGNSFRVHRVKSVPCIQLAKYKGRRRAVNRDPRELRRV